MFLTFGVLFSSYTENVGSTETRGFEVMATALVVRNNDRQIYWSVTGNLIHTKDKIVELSQAIKDEVARIQSMRGSNPNKILREGDPINAIYVVRSLGIDPSTGRELYMTKDGDVTYDWNSNDRIMAGIEQPDFRGNVNTTFRWRDISVSASFGYFWGGQAYNQTLINKVENADKIYNVDRRVLTDRWAKPGDRAAFRGLNETMAINASSRFVQDNAVFRCQNINVSYVFRDTRWQSRLGIEALTISANTAEMFYWTTIKQERGLDYPFSRNFSLSASILF